MKKRRRSFLILWLAAVAFLFGRHALLANGITAWKMWFLFLSLAAFASIILIVRGKEAGSLVAGGVLIATAFTIAIRTASLISEDTPYPRLFLFMIGAVLFFLEGASVLTRNRSNK